MPEATPDVIKRLVDQGGQILVVGGRTSKWPRQYQEHPQIQILDDETSSLARKEVPANVRAVLFSPHVSHATVHRILRVARDRGVTIFPIMRTADLKHALSALVAPITTMGDYQEPVTETLEQIEQEPESVPLKTEVLTTEGVQTMPRSKKHEQLFERGEAAQIIAGLLKEHGDPEEARKAFGKLAEKRGSSKGAWTQAWRKFSTSAPSVTTTIRVPKAAPESDDATEQALKLVDDAIASLQLVKEVVRNMNKRSAKLSKLKELLAGL